MASEIDKLDFYLADESGYSPEDYVKDAQLLKPAFIYCDYAQLLRREQFLKTHESLAFVLAIFKRLSKEANCGIILGSQLNRQFELKASGALEEVSDSVIELEWKGKDKKDPQEQGDYFVKISKQRHGPTGNVKLWYRADQFRFMDA